MIEFLQENWTLIAAVITGLIAWHKDVIMNKIGIKTAKIEGDSVHISNSKQLMDLYRKSVDDLNVIKEAHIEQIKANHKEEVADIRTEHLKNINDIKLQHSNNDKDHKTKFRKLEKDFQDSVNDLKGQIQELKAIVEALTKERDYYKKQANEVKNNNN